MAAPKSLVSVVITTYNARLTIFNVLDAVMMASEFIAEVIVVDDNSNDNTLEIVKSNFPEVIIISKNDNSGGPARPRNIGLKASRSDYVMFCDADDVISTEYIKLAVSKVRSGEFAIFSGLRQNITAYTEFDVRKNFRRPSISKISYQTLSLKDRVTLSGSLVNRSKLNYTFNEDVRLHGVEDYLFFLQNAKSGVNIGRLNNRAIGYLISETNISKNKLSRIKKFILLNRINGRWFITSVIFTITHYFIALLERLFNRYY
jgi:teichuronic acid biosynthesis glycosyltransferase TuaG